MSAWHVRRVFEVPRHQIRVGRRDARGLAARGASPNDVRHPGILAEPERYTPRMQPEDAPLTATYVRVLVIEVVIVVGLWILGRMYA